MTTTAYDVGALRRLSINFQSIAGVDTDPTEVTLVIREPDGAETSKTYGASEITRSDAGDFYYDFTITKAGRHVWRMSGTGALVASAGAEFYARRKQVTT